METTEQIATDNRTYVSKFKISVRRSPYFMLKGDDAENHNIKIGASLKGKSILRGLDYDEEKVYLPNIIGISPQDMEWGRATKAYWCDIAVPVAADGATSEELQGRVIEFDVEFKQKSQKTEFEELLSFEDKAAHIKKYGKVIDGIDDYVLFRYCLVYSRVSNTFEDVGKSAKIRFYLFSPRTETLAEHKKFKDRTEARKQFIGILTDETKIDAVLRVFGQSPDFFKTIEDKHLALETLIDDDPSTFLKEITDENLAVKAFIKKAVDKQVIYNPANTESYYYGENQEVCLGNTLTDTILYLKSTNEKSKEIVAAIKARVKN